MDSDDEPDDVLDASLASLEKQSASTSPKYNHPADWWASIAPADRTLVFDAFFPRAFQHTEPERDPLDIRIQYTTIRSQLHAALVTSSESHRACDDLLLAESDFVFAMMGWAMDSCGLPEGYETHAIWSVLQLTNSTTSTLRSGFAVVEPSRVIELWGRLFAAIQAAKFSIDNFNADVAESLMQAGRKRAEATSQEQTSATGLRESGNSHFEKKEFRQAVDDYTRGIGRSPTDHLLLLNRAAARMKLDDVKGALDDCLEYSFFSPHNEPPDRLAKGLMRLAKCIQLSSDNVNHDNSNNIKNTAALASLLLTWSLATHPTPLVRKAAEEIWTPPVLHASLAASHASPGLMHVHPVPRTFPRALAETVDPLILRQSSKENPFRLMAANHTDLHTVLFTLCDIRYRLMEAEGCPLLTDATSVTPDAIESAVERLVANPAHIQLILSEPSFDALARDLVVLVLISSYAPSSSDREKSELALTVVAVMENYLLTRSQHDRLVACLEALVQASQSPSHFSKVFPWMQLAGAAINKPEQKLVSVSPSQAPQFRTVSGDSNTDALDSSSMLTLLRYIWCRWLQVANCSTTNHVDAFESREEGAFFKTHGYVRLPNDIRRKFSLPDRNDDETPIFRNATLSSALTGKEMERDVAVDAVRTGQYPVLATWFPMWHDAVGQIGEMLVCNGVATLTVVAAAGSVTQVCHTLLMQATAGDLGPSLAHNVDLISVADALETDGLVPVLLAMAPLLKRAEHATIDTEILTGDSTDSTSVESCADDYFNRVLGSTIDPGSLFAFMGLSCGTTSAGPGQLGIQFQWCSDSELNELFGDSEQQHMGEAFMGLWCHVLRDQWLAPTNAVLPRPRHNTLALLKLAHRISTVARDHPDHVTRITSAITKAVATLSPHHKLSLTAALSNNKGALATQLGLDTEFEKVGKAVSWRRWRIAPAQTSAWDNMGSVVALLTTDSFASSTMARAIVESSATGDLENVFRTVFGHPGNVIQVMVDGVVVQPEAGLAQVLLPSSWACLCSYAFGVNVPAVLDDDGDDDAHKQRDPTLYLVLLDVDSMRVVSKVLAINRDSFTAALAETADEKEERAQFDARIKRHMQSHPLNEVMHMLEKV